MAIDQAHFRALERMYAAAPINDFYHPTMTISEGAAEIDMRLTEKHLHSAGSAHGSVYFKMLDDAAFFAANSLETEVFLVTTSFTTYMTRPVSEGTLRATGQVVNRNRTQFIAEAVLYNGAGKEIGRGNGLFVRTKKRLRDALGYQG